MHTFDICYTTLLSVRNPIEVPLRAREGLGIGTIWNLVHRTCWMNAHLKGWKSTAIKMSLLRDRIDRSKFPAHRILVNEVRYQLQTFRCYTGPVCRSSWIMMWQHKWKQDRHVRVRGKPVQITSGHITQLGFGWEFHQRIFIQRFALLCHALQHRYTESLEGVSNINVVSGDLVHDCNFCCISFTALYSTENASTYESAIPRKSMRDVPSAFLLVKNRCSPDVANGLVQASEGISFTLTFDTQTQHIENHYYIA